MSKKITHEQVKSMINNLNEGLNFRLFNVMVDYIAQQERLDNELTNTMIIANSRLERLNGLELEFDKQQKLLDLYKEALETNFEGITLIKLVNKTLRTQIKELEND